jgi:hypothetical protein
LCSVCAGGPAIRPSGSIGAPIANEDGVSRAGIDGHHDAAFDGSSTATAAGRIVAGSRITTLTASATASAAVPFEKDNGDSRGRSKRPLSDECRGLNDGSDRSCACGSCGSYLPRGSLRTSGGTLLAGRTCGTSRADKPVDGDVAVLAIATAAAVAGHAARAIAACTAASATRAAVENDAVVPVLSWAARHATGSAAGSACAALSTEGAWTVAATAAA